MTPPLCNNMNGDSVGCLASQNFACTIYSLMWLCFSRCLGFIRGLVSVWRKGQGDTETADTIQEEAEANLTSCHVWVGMWRKKEQQNWCNATQTWQKQWCWELDSYKEQPQIWRECSVCVCACVCVGKYPKNKYPSHPNNQSELLAQSC